MKKIFIILSAMLILSACQTVNQSADQPKFEETHWKLIAINKKTVDLGDNAFIEFKGDKASGKAACNTFSAEIIKVNSKLAFENVVSTKMFCDGMMDYENQFITNLGKVKRIDIRYGLLYMYGSDDLLMTFKK